MTIPLLLESRPFLPSGIPDLCNSHVKIITVWESARIYSKASFATILLKRKLLAIVHPPYRADFFVDPCKFSGTSAAPVHRHAGISVDRKIKAEEIFFSFSSSQAEIVSLAADSIRPAPVTVKPVASDLTVFRAENLDRLPKVIQISVKVFSKSSSIQSSVV